MAVNAQAWKKFPIAQRNQPYDADDAQARIGQWAAGSTEKYNMGFLWRNSQGPPNNKNSYRLPIIDIMDGKPVLVPHAVQSAARILSGAHGGLENVVGEEERQELKSVVSAIYEKFQELWGDPRTKPPWELGGNEPGGTVPEVKASGTPEDEFITAAVVPVPVKPPAAWFEDPRLDRPTSPLQITADGQVRGHIAFWNICHEGIRDECVMAPKNYSGYKFFHNGDVLTADGQTVRIGKITLGTGHAGPGGIVAAREHYDNTGTAVVVARVGEDQFGIWASGAVVPGTTEEKVAELRRSPISGDWRGPRHEMELVGALAVNDPGFNVARLLASAGEDEEGLILVADATAIAREHEHECAPCEAKRQEALTAAFSAIDAELDKIGQMQRAARLAAVKED